MSRQLNDDVGISFLSDIPANAIPHRREQLPVEKNAHFFTYYTRCKSLIIALWCFTVLFSGTNHGEHRLSKVNIRSRRMLNNGSVHHLSPLHALGSQKRGPYSPVARSRSNVHPRHSTWMAYCCILSRLVFQANRHGNILILTSTVDDIVYFAEFNACLLTRQNNFAKGMFACMVCCPQLCRKELTK